MNFDIKPFDYLHGFTDWLIVFGAAVGVALVAALMASLVASRSATPFFRQLREGAIDMIRMSPRRIWAISQLTIREAVRRKALMVFVVFAVLFMFAGWFLSESNSRPDMQVKVYVSFVLGAITWLLLPVVLLQACWGIPEDIRLRSMHTVVTKPTRRNEIVIGRFVGFSLVGSVVLLIMGTVGYVWIMRQVPEEARSHLVSRKPVWGELSFLDQQGNPTSSGINVGDIWEHRSYIAGGTAARAVWEFEGVTPDQVGESLILESTFEAFRTFKGNIGEGLLVQYYFVNPETGLKVPHEFFEVQEFGQNVTQVDRKLSYYDDESKSMKTVDLFNDLVFEDPEGATTDLGDTRERLRDNVLRVEALCLNDGQFLGMGRPDLFIRLPDRSFFSGYAKAIIGIWLLMLLVVAFGVTASCFAKGPVASLLTFFLLIVGTGFHGFLEQLVSGELKGSGAIESMYRIAAHLNPQVALSESLATRVMQFADVVIAGGLWLLYNIVPNLNVFRLTPYVANGFDVPWNAALVPCLLTTLAYLVPCLLLAYYSLKLRELEAK